MIGDVLYAFVDRRAHRLVVLDGHSASPVEDITHPSLARFGAAEAMLAERGWELAGEWVDTGRSLSALVRRKADPPA
jgi:hypothetical protein